MAYFRCGISNIQKFKGTAVDVTDLPAPIASFRSNASGVKLDSLKVLVEAQQDLHGYDKPWAGGGGANLWGGDKMYDDFVATEQVTSGTDSTGKYIQWYSTATWSIPLTCEANTQYTLMLYGWRNTATTEGTSYGFNCRLYYSDETFTNITVVSAGNQVPARIVVVSSANKTLTSIGVINHGGYSRIYTDNCGLFKGVKTASDFVPWENICPISGWNGCDVTRTGKNVWDEEWRNGYYTNGVYTFLANYVCSKNPIEIKPNTTYYALNGEAQGRLVIAQYDINGDFISNILVRNASFTTDSKAYSINFYLEAQLQSYNNNVSINYPSTDTAYHAYNGNTYTIQFGDTYYGGELDVTNGVLRVTKGMVDLSDLTWVSGGSSVFAAVLSGLVVRTSGLSPLVCECYQTDNVSNITPTSDNVIWQYYNTSNIRVKDTRYSTLADFSDNVSGKLVFELATPFTIQLTAQQIEQLEENNIWADTGDVSECKYIQISQIGG